MQKPTNAFLIASALASLATLSHAWDRCCHLPPLHGSQGVTDPNPRVAEQRPPAWISPPAGPWATPALVGTEWLIHWYSGLLKSGIFWTTASKTQECKGSRASTGQIWESESRNKGHTRKTLGLGLQFQPSNAIKWSTFLLFLRSRCEVIFSPGD